MKRIISLCLALVLIFTLFSACPETEPDRSYEKTAHECGFISTLDGCDGVLLFVPCSQLQKKKVSP